MIYGRKSYAENKQCWMRSGGGGWGWGRVTRTQKPKVGEPQRKAGRRALQAEANCIRPCFTNKIMLRKLGVFSFVKNSLVDCIFSSSSETLETRQTVCLLGLVGKILYP